MFTMNKTQQISIIVLAFAAICFLAQRAWIPDESQTIPPDSEVLEPAQGQATTPQPALIQQPADVLPPVADIVQSDVLQILYESPIESDKLRAAQQIASHGTEEAFLQLAAFVAAAEGTGDDAHLRVAKLVASVLGGMHSDEILDIALELAYSPSPLVAEAAVTASVASNREAIPQWIDPGAVLDPTEIADLEALLQQHLTYDVQGSADSKPD
jgi:hypothetical protein